MKVTVIGCTHAGTAAIANLAKHHPKAELTVYERNDNISFLSCGIALYLEGVVKDPSGLFYSSPEDLASLGVNVKMRHNVTGIDFEGKKVKAKNIATGEEVFGSWDKLIITTGSWPILPRFSGADLGNVLLCKNYDHAKSIIAKAENSSNVAIIGAGYIGVELAEAFSANGKNTTLIDMSPRIMSKYMDAEFTAPAEDALASHGVKLALGESVVEIKGQGGSASSVVTNNGEYPAELVIVCIGFKPTSDLFRGKINTLPNGAIIVDEYMRSSLPDVFAAGDCASIFYNPTGENDYIPLATNAIRMGALAAINLLEPKIKYLGTQATSGIKIYDLNLAATGLTEEAAKQLGMPVNSVTVKDSYVPEFMPEFTEATLKLVYNSRNRVLLGAQLLSRADYTQTINTLAVCLQNKMTIEQIAFVDQFFQPNFNKPWNLMNTAALAAL
ncbi:MAG: FAD-dependent oxidoreductase [Clostridiales bacterium]|jgi:NADPH-dependent 2,4-dienoyl-CoA reductase/sulfur reductase-like enzyme|nr:FAD-dependent oxidoreductase [Clostridiales bacterium]